MRPNTAIFILALADAGRDHPGAANQNFAWRQNDNDVVSIDFDVPRHGPLCISVDEGDDMEFVWEEYHNLNRMPNKASYEECDFANAVPLASDGSPNPLGHRVPSNATDGENVLYFSCSKICRSNGHKVKVCVGGGGFGKANECAADGGTNGFLRGCTPERTVDMRRQTRITTNKTSIPREYIAVGRVCRPKNGDGYSIASGIDTPESCQQKCDDDSTRCGAWEYEDHGSDDKECELHERNVISYRDTQAMGECQLSGDSESMDGGYRCCWIAEDVVDSLQDTTNSMTTTKTDYAMTLILVVVTTMAALR